jgi:hypothetical protein
MGYHARRLGPHHEPRRRERIAADVHDPAPGEVVREQPAAGVEGRVIAEARLDVPHRADCSIPHEAHERLGLRMDAVHECFHQEAAGRRRGILHGHDLGVVETLGLFAEHGLAGLQGAQGPLGMLRMRCRDVDRVDAGVGEQRLVAAEARRAGEPVGELGRLRAIPARDGGEAIAFGAPERGGEGPGDAARGQDAPAKVGHLDAAPGGS